jgi:hypothetical protein
MTRYIVVSRVYARFFARLSSCRVVSWVLVCVAVESLDRIRDDSNRFSFLVKFVDQKSLGKDHLRPSTLRPRIRTQRLNQL